MSFCKCGCGQEVKRNFLRGHSARVRMAIPAEREKIREALKVGWASGRIKIWNKGKKQTPESNAKRSKTLMGRKGLSGKRNPMWGRTGEKNPMFGKSHSPKAIKAIKEARSRVKWTPESNKKRSKTLKGRTIHWIDKIVKSCGAKPNKAEKRLNIILRKLLPGEYKLNVKANVMTLGGRTPDFVNVNGQKKLIELYGDFWHKGQDPQVRINYFKTFGWDTLVIWESELKDESFVEDRVVRFHNQHRQGRLNR